jgi:hypothetical protein
MKKSELKNIISEEVRLTLINEMDDMADEVLFHIQKMPSEDARKLIWNAYQDGHLSSRSAIKIAKATGGSIEEGHGLDDGDLNYLKDLVQPGGPAKGRLKKILDFIIKSNIKVDKTKDLSVDEVTSQKQKQWACAQINSKNRPDGLSKAQAEEMCRSEVKEEILRVLRKK